jgi:sporulation protein YlmC with PRC-barrel domain
MRVLGCTCAVLSICSLALSAQAQSENPYEARMTATLMQQSSFSLASAIQTAEQHTAGRAVNADAFVPPAWQTGGSQQLKYAVTTVSGNNQLQTVFIDGQTGRVEHVQQAMIRGAMGTTSGFQSSCAQSPGQSYTGGGQPETYYSTQPSWQQGAGTTWQQSQGMWQPRYGGTEFGQPGGTGQRWQGMYGPRGEWQPGYGGSQFNQPQGRWGEQQFRSQPGFEEQTGEGFEAQRYGGENIYSQQSGGQMQGGMAMAIQPELASYVIGATVRNNQNQDLGRIEDLAINSNTGRVPFAILNMNDKLYPIPFRLINLVGQDQVVLNVPRDRIDNLPTLNKADWPQTVNARLAAAVHRMLGLQQEPTSEFGFAGYSDQPGNTPPGAPQTQPSPTGGQGMMPIRKASELMDKPVLSPQGEMLGTIKDLVIDPQRSRMAYAIVSFKNMGENLVAVPWDAFRVQQNQIMVNADMNRVQQAQALSFTANNWPDMSNPEWAQREAEFFGTQPYPMMGPSQMGHMRGGEQRMGGQGQQLPPQSPGQQQP